MSAWGYISEEAAKRRVEDRPDDAAQTIERMSHRLLEQERRINELQNEVSALKDSAIEDAQEVGRLRGYIQRVRETDGFSETER